MTFDNVILMIFSFVLRNINIACIIIIQHLIEHLNNNYMVSYKIIMNSTKLKKQNYNNNQNKTKIQSVQWILDLKNYHHQNFFWLLNRAKKNKKKNLWSTFQLHCTVFFINVIFNREKENISISFIHLFYFGHHQSIARSKITINQFSVICIWWEGK